MNADKRMTAAEFFRRLSLFCAFICALILLCDTVLSLKRESVTVSHTSDKGTYVMPSAPPGALDINTATQKELMTLPGIGKAISQKIIDFREIEPFYFIEDIQYVSGIGEKRFESIKPLITVQAEPASD